jgi:hypothetical protein
MVMSVLLIVQSANSIIKQLKNVFVQAVNTGMVISAFIVTEDKLGMQL